MSVGETPKTGSDLRFGVNYTPRVGWFHSWLDFDADAIARDFDAIAALGMDHVRIFPLWPLLQPNRTLIRERALDDVARVVELAHERGMDTWVDALQGHLSSYDFLPSWVVTWHAQDLFTSPDVRSGQRALIAALGERLRDVPGARGICVGNEFPQFAATRHPQASNVDADGAREWLTEMLGAAGAAWPGGEHVHCFDDDLWFDPTHPFRPDLAVTQGAMTTLHSWVFMQVGPRYGERHPALVRFARYLVELALAWAGRERAGSRRIWLQETGAPVTAVAAADAPDFAVQTVRNLLDVPELWGVTWWCSHDVSRELADFPELEYSLGLIDAEGRAKPIGRALAELIAALRAGEDLRNVRVSGDDGRATVRVPSAPETRADLAPRGEFFDLWQRTWQETGLPPRIELN